MHTPSAVTLLLLLSTSSMSTSAALPRPESCFGLVTASYHTNTTTPTIYFPQTASLTTSTTSIPLNTLSNYRTASTPGSTNIPSLSVPSSASGSVPTPGHCLDYLLHPYSTTCHSNIDNTNSSTKSESSTKQSIDINTVVSIVFGAAQVLLSIWPTQAAWRFLHHRGNGGVGP